MIKTIDEYKLMLESTGKGTIYFRNFTQKVLWDNEMAGQLSDGFWENSPGSNWEFWTGLNTAVDAENPRVDTRTHKKYNFNLANKELLDVVGDRMLAMAKMSKVTQNEDVCKAAEYLEGINSEEELHKYLSRANKYFQEKLNVISDADFQKWLKVPYTMSQMIADLKDMSAIMKTAGGIELPAPKIKTTTDGSIDDKDTTRIKGIIAKAKGDKTKEVQLATTMANTITDKAKALRRAEAATALNLPEIAAIFTDKAKTL